MMTDMKPFVINAVAYWASLKDTNRMSGKYQIDLSGLSPEAVELLKSRGMKPRNKDDDRGSFITAKSNSPIRYYDTDGNEMSAAVGNGSKVKVVLGHYDWTSPNGAKGRSPSILKLVVTDLIEYVSETSSDYDLAEAV
jgi:hypothetical protein